MSNNKVSNLIELWKEARTAINLLESRLTDLRVKGLTLVAALTSLAITLYRLDPAFFVQARSPIGIRPSTFVEAVAIIAILILAWQDRVYHRWLYGAFANAMEIEDRISKEIGLEDCEKTRLMLTHSISRRRSISPPTEEWGAMLKSRSFWIGMSMYALALVASGGLFLYMLQFR